MAEHTELPWRVFRTKDLVYIGVGDGNAEGILDAGFGLWKSGPERDANAEFIVNAVNSHADLVAALRTIASLGGNLPDERLTSKTGPNDAVSRGLMYTSAREIARAALTKAGETV